MGDDDNSGPGMTDEGAVDEMDESVELDGWPEGTMDHLRLHFNLTLSFMLLYFSSFVHTTYLTLLIHTCTISYIEDT